MPTVHLPLTLAAWSGPQREAVLKQELEQLDPGLLPLREAMARGNQVAVEPVRVLVLTTGEGEDCLQARVGLLFASLIGGCQCADDPSPLEVLPEYAELQIWIDRLTGAAQWWLLD
ncbi:MAG: hypothetical protein EOM92_04540 [Gammaproteobacteria bacterium]|nr:hypothetical protein [Gammaproteobacteria bacterium]